MAAPTNAAKREENPCQPGAVHTWHETDMPTASRDVRSQGQSGKHLLGLSFSSFDDPKRTWGIAGHRPTIVLYSHSTSPSMGGTLSGKHVERRLAAILAADVAGSCRL